MSQRDEWLAWQREETLESYLHTRPFVYVVREAWVHVDNTTGEKCPCCESMNAVRVAIEPVCELIIDRITGYRLMRKDAKDPAEFDAFVEEACERVKLPMRCYEKQYEAIKAFCKVLLIEGGIRGGKTETLVAIFLSHWLLKGGPGVTLWWVAPNLKHLAIAFTKLFEGEAELGVQKDPAIPPELVVSRPHNPLARDLTATLVDGTKIVFWHAANEKQFKGQLPSLIGVDEGAEIAKTEILNQLLDRVMQSRGRVIIPTTPIAGAPVHEIHNAGVNIEKWDGSFAKQVWARLTSFDNPWIDKQAIEDHIATVLKGDKARIRRDIYGEWVGSGNTMWREYDSFVHLCQELPSDLVDITNLVARPFFRRSDIDMVGGLDFNVVPMSFVAMRIMVPRGKDQRDPKNWIAVFIDEVVEDGTVYTFADHLAGTPYRKAAISCDSSGALRHANEAHGVSDTSTLATEMRAKGFTIYPCNLSGKGKPMNPGLLESCNLVHKLMSEEVEGTSYRRFLVSTKCVRLLKAIETQQSDPQGKPIKVAGTPSDKLAGPSDAARYIIWSMFRAHDLATPKFKART